MSAAAAASLGASKVSPVGDTKFTRLPLPTTAKHIPQNSAPYSQRRLFFMPPGQPSYAILPMDAASWIRHLAAARWVPGRDGAAGPNSKRGWYRPCEVMLKPDPARPGLPVAELPADVLKGLQSESLKNLFAWGTVAPEPPVDRLADVASGRATDNTELLWRAIAHAHRLGSLKPDQKQKLKALAQMPVFPVPSEGLLDKAAVVSASRCVATTSTADAADAEEVRALLSAKWLVDVYSPTWPLRDVLEEILTLVDIPTGPNKQCAESFVAWCCKEEPEDAFELRDAFTHALARIWQGSKLPLKPPEGMKRLVPNLKLFCKEGPGLGKGRFAARWLPAFQKAEAGSAVPVLNDCPSKAALLTPAQGFQLLGVLDHPESRFPSGARMEEKDRKLINALGILRLSDPALQLQTKISGNPMVLGGSCGRLTTVLKLLWIYAGKQFPDDGLDIKLCKCISITRELSMKGGKAVQMEAFAIWGEPDANGCSVLLVSGDPDDYVAEVEELFEAKFDTLFQACASRPAKVLRLLRHLENEREFNKFVARDFSGVIDIEEAERKRAEAQRQAELELERAKQEELEAQRRAAEEAERQRREAAEQKEREEKKRQELKQRLEQKRIQEEQERLEQQRIREDEQRENDAQLAKQRLEEDQLTHAHEEIVMSFQIEKEIAEAYLKSQEDEMLQDERPALGFQESSASEVPVMTPPPGQPHEMMPPKMAPPLGEPPEMAPPRGEPPQMAPPPGEPPQMAPPPLEPPPMVPPPGEPTQMASPGESPAMALSASQPPQMAQPQGEAPATEPPAGERQQMAPPLGEPPAMLPPPGEPPKMAPPLGEPPAMVPPEGEPPPVALEGSSKRSLLAGFVAASKSQCSNQLEAGAEDPEAERDAKRQKIVGDSESTEKTERKPEDGEPEDESLDKKMAKMQRELEALRQENEQLKTASVFPFRNPASSLLDFDASDDDNGPVTKGQIKRMKLEAKEVLHRPISEGFGFKMLEKMGWQAGEGLGSSFKGITEPIWVDPREGKCGLFSAESGEQRPKRFDGPESERFVVTERNTFVKEGQVIGAGGVTSLGSNSGRAGLGLPPQERQRPTVRSVTPAVFSLLQLQNTLASSASSSSHGGQVSEVSNVFGDVLAEVLQGEVGDRFLRLLSDRLGPQVAPQMAEMRRSRAQAPDSSAHTVLQPLWSLTRHHVPGTTEEDDDF
eukprot:TRINITY_DN6456_c0_g1_i2.p1 TRINITY_DN6456_c0_g1~~TRINITY_DN6456_c0_g1_i2.p1  ORF type:complete len:1398 (-),score=386.41 TRINITY_DN6456_c0_g1_i2:212-3799(-)